MTKIIRNDYAQIEGLSIKDISKNIHDNATNHGFWVGATTTQTIEKLIPEKIVLCHSELSEALEEYRKGIDPTLLYYNSDDPKPEGFGVELADCVIRILDLCYALDIDIERLMQLKHEYNITRPYKHGKKV